MIAGFARPALANTFAIQEALARAPSIVLRPYLPADESTSSWQDAFIPSRRRRCGPPCAERISSARPSQTNAAITSHGVEYARSSCLLRRQSGRSCFWVLVCYDVSNDFGSSLVPCSECNGTNGSPPATSDGHTCYIITGDSSTRGNSTACPGDPASIIDLDGTYGNSVGTGILTAYLCQVAREEGIVGFASWAACFI